MKNYILLFFAVLTTKLSFSQKQKVVANTDGNCNDVKWALKFEDNFDGPSLDLNKWHMKYAPGTLSTEAVDVYYSIDNIKLENGICKIIPKIAIYIRRTLKSTTYSALT